MGKTFIARLLEEIAPTIGASILIEPNHGFVGQLTFSNGKRSLFRQTKLDINGFGSAELAKDKAYSKYFLAKLGYQVTEGKAFFREHIRGQYDHLVGIYEGCQYADSLGFPVIVKPLGLSKGILVTKVFSSSEYYDTANRIFATGADFLVERFYSGNDYRIIVLDDRALIAYQRIPLRLQGDGEKSVIELLNGKKQEFALAARNVNIDPEDFRVTQNLSRLSMNLESIIPCGETVYLLDNANMSNGGDAIDVSKEIHPSFQRLAVNIARDVGLRLVGIDIIAPNISEQLDEYRLIEVNGSPSLSHYASTGTAQMENVKSLYRKVLLAIQYQ